MRDRALGSPSRRQAQLGRLTASSLLADMIPSAPTAQSAQAQLKDGWQDPGRCPALPHKQMGHKQAYDKHVHSLRQQGRVQLTRSRSEVVEPIRKLATLYGAVPQLPSASVRQL